MSIRMLRKESVLVVRSLDYARDDSSAVNSPSTSVGMTMRSRFLDYARNDIMAKDDIIRNDRKHNYCFKDSARAILSQRLFISLSACPLTLIKLTL